MRGRFGWYRGDKVVILHTLVDFPGYYAVFLVKSLRFGDVKIVNSRDLDLTH